MFNVSVYLNAHRDQHEKVVDRRLSSCNDAAAEVLRDDEAMLAFGCRRRLDNLGLDRQLAIVARHSV